MSKYNIRDLTLEEKIGQLFVFGFDALKVNEHAIRLIQTYKAGNVILFTRNVKTPEQLFKLNQNLQKLAIKEIGIPMIICIDQEGGMVTRIKNSATFFPGAMTITASSELENSYLTGKYMGAELSALGINMNLAPVLDVNNNPFNPVIGVRSFSDDEALVSSYGVEYIKGMQESVIATAKHFPGHGDTKIDSHLALPKIEKSIEELEEIELVPFKKAIENGLHAIMSSHINFPAITEEGRPTTLSKNVLTDLLRERLKFEGLIITDCMQMQAIQKNYTTEEGARMAIEAGANLICVSHSEELQTAAINRVKEAVLSGELDEQVLDERIERILSYKREYAKPQLDNQYDSVKELVEDKQVKEFSYNVVKNAMTLVRGSNIVIDKNTLLIASDPISTTIADEDVGSHSIVKEVRKANLSVDVLNVSIRLTEDGVNDIIAKSSKYETGIFCSYNANIYKNQITLIKHLMKNSELYVIAMRNPYDLVFAPEIKNLICMYEYTPNSVKALIEYLKGSFLPQGILPVTL